MNAPDPNHNYKNESKWSSVNSEILPVKHGLFMTFSWPWKQLCCIVYAVIVYRHSHFLYLFRGPRVMISKSNISGWIWFVHWLKWMLEKVLEQYF